MPSGPRLLCLPTRLVSSPRDPTLRGKEAVSTRDSRGSVLRPPTGRSWWTHELLRGDAGPGARVRDFPWGSRVSSLARGPQAREPRCGVWARRGSSRVGWAGPFTRAALWGGRNLPGLQRRKLRIGERKGQAEGDRAGPWRRGALSPGLSPSPHSREWKGSSLIGRIWGPGTWAFCDWRAPPPPNSP